MGRRETDNIPNSLEALCKGVLPNVAERIKRAYWLGVAEAGEVLRPEIVRDAHKALLLNCDVNHLQ